MWHVLTISTSKDAAVESLLSETHELKLRDLTSELEKNIPGIAYQELHRYETSDESATDET